MKKIGFVLLVLLNSLLVFGNESISVGVLNGPSAIPTGYMKENVKQIDNANLNIEIFPNPSALLPKMLKKEVDIGFLPGNVAAKVFNSSNGAIICCAITGTGNLSLVTKDKSIKRFSDLKNKIVYVAGQGATPEYMLRYLLKENDVDVKDSVSTKTVMLDFSIPTSQLPAQLLSNKVKYAVIPEPFVSVVQLKSKDVVVAIDIQKEYETIVGKGETYPLTVMVVRKEFAEENPKLVEAFMKEYEKSYKWTIKNPNKAGELSEKYFGLKKPVVVKAIPNSNYCFIKAEDGKKSMESLLKIFMEYEPKSIGGKLPGDEFYFSGE